MVEWDYSMGNSIVLSTTEGIAEVVFQEDYEELNGIEGRDKSVKGSALFQKLKDISCSRVIPVGVTIVFWGIRVVM